MFHGGQLEEAKRQFPHVGFDWIDLSTGINPNSYPFANISSERFTQLPSFLDEKRLREVAAKAYDATNLEFVVTAPGTQILISLLPYIFKARQVCILCPTYMEHVKTWQNAGIETYQVSSLEVFMEFAKQEYTIGVLCNPNNPDGRLFSIQEIKAISDQWAYHGNKLIVDEAFMDFEGGSAAQLLPHSALIILRSFGKTYGLAGVRLGFLLSVPEYIQQIRDMLGPWAVSGSALQIGLQALQDRSWLLESKTQLTALLKQLDHLFTEQGCKIIGGTHLYRLLEYDKAPDLWNHLAQQGIWVRKFDYNPHWLRFGLPHHHEWGRVQKAIKSYFEGC